MNFLSNNAKGIIIETEELHMYDIYQSFYQRVEFSKAFGKYCKKVFGIDLSQDGFTSLNQLKLLLSKLNITSSDLCLDIGCGNGKIAEYISDQTQAKIIGIDYSEIAIKYGLERTRSKRNRLDYLHAEINNFEIKKDKFSVIYLIDSIYFSKDYLQTIKNILSNLKPGGRLGIFYSDFVFEKDKQIKKIEFNETAIAQVFHKINQEYSYIDLIKEHYEHMKLKNKIGKLMFKDFLKEGNMQLQEKIVNESIADGVSFDDFSKFSNRYLYVVKNNFH